MTDENEMCTQTSMFGLHSFQPPTLPQPKFKPPLAFGKVSLKMLEISIIGSYISYLPHESLKDKPN